MFKAYRLGYVFFEYDGAFAMFVFRVQHSIVLCVFFMFVLAYWLI